MPKFYTAKDLIGILGLSKNTVYSHLESGKIKSVRIGKGGYRVSQDEVDRLTRVGGTEVVKESTKTVPLNQEGKIGLMSKVRKNKQGGDLGDVVEKIEKGTFRFRVKKGEFLSLFDWFMGLVAVMFGLSAFLLPGSLFIQISGCLQSTYLTVGAVMFVAGLSYLLMGMIEMKNKGWVMLVRWMMLLGYVFLAYVNFRSGVFEGLVLYLSLSLVLVVDSWWDELLGVVKFILLLFLVILGGSVIMGYEHFFQGIGLRYGQMISGWSVIAMLIFGFVFLIGSLLSLKKKGFWLRVLLFVSGMFFVGASFFLAGNKLWDRVVLYILLGLFSFIFPHYKKFEGFKYKNSKTVILGFIYSLVVMAIAAGLGSIVRNTFESHVEKRLEQRLVLDGDRVQDFFNEAKNEILSLGESVILERLLIEGDMEGVKGMVIDSYKSTQGLMRLMVFDKEGTMIEIYPHTEPSIEGWDFSFREYFKKSEKGEFYASDLFEPVIPHDNWAMVMSGPIYDSKGGFLGVVAGRLDFTEFEESLSEIDESLSVVLDRNGRVIVSDREDIVYLGDGLIWSEIKEKGSGLVRMMLGGELMTVAYETIPDLGWTILVASPVVDSVGLVDVLVMIGFFLTTVLMVLFRMGFLRGIRRREK